MEIHNEPLPSLVYEDHASFEPEADSLYIGFEGIEERSGHFQNLVASSNSVKFLEVVREGETEFETRLVGTTGTTTHRLRSRKQLAELWTAHESASVYLDITGLRHHVWIPLLRSALSLSNPVHVIYVEPEQYRHSLTPTESQIFDLSERIEGIAPIPGFASLRRTTDEFIFLPLLGFEGTRLAYLLEQVQPLNDKIVPIVGVPGYLPEHPFNSFLGNRIALQETDAWQRVRYADANCPFSLFYLLEQIEREFRPEHSKIAVIGTKPHALGGALFVLGDPTRRELIYDHPVRKTERTSGVGRLLQYEVSEFMR
ncbi:hypothetical protein [Neorhodopirellula pilleata]|uniref:Uncharacterized protein n=1 Tax=Neorhodopirellula pilleata TaxID=2714738 RepID=A0A5C6A157_9BACT|nr:hypothetical protein [Neorhodopirellula pilleata]TWT92938.1 hypothetical protein Pla100_42540 [Neorhodopirellula pilleata]